MTSGEEVMARVRAVGGPELLLAGATIVTPGRIIEDGWVRAAQGLIAELGGDRPPRGAADLNGSYLIPGLIDLHVHGGGGVSFMDTEADLETALAAHAVWGTTTLLATTMSAPWDELVAAVARLGTVERSGKGARLAGINLEGPFLSQARRGAHPAGTLAVADPGRIRQLVTAARDRATIITAAPEIDGFDHLVGSSEELGYKVAIGHTDADHRTTQRAIATGARLATHLWNGMPPFHHRKPGPVGAFLAEPEAYVELVVDLTHVHPVVLEASVAAKGRHRVCFVTDAVAPAGAPNLKQGRMGGTLVTVDGYSCRAEDGSLYGTATTLGQAIPRLARQTRLGLPGIISMMASTPARFLGIEEAVGTIEVGRNADLVVLDRESLEVTAVYLGGTRLPVPPMSP